MCMHAQLQCNFNKNVLQTPVWQLAGDTVLTQSYATLQDLPLDAGLCRQQKCQWPAAAKGMLANQKPVLFKIAWQRMTMT